MPTITTSSNKLKNLTKLTCFIIKYIYKKKLTPNKYIFSIIIKQNRELNNFLTHSKIKIVLRFYAKETNSLKDLSINETPNKPSYLSSMTHIVTCVILDKTFYYSFSSLA